MYSSRRVNGRTRKKLECVCVSMCVCSVDVCERNCVVSECERVNVVDLHICIYIFELDLHQYIVMVCVSQWKGYV